VASQLDIAPTVAELLGIRDTTPWLGRSLLAPPARGAEVGLLHGDVLFAETPAWSLVLDPTTAAPHLYDPVKDPLQREDLAPGFPAEAARLERELRDQQAMWDYLVESDRVWPARERDGPLGGTRR
jgi:arylsulfatase A-like enzyme